MKSGKNIWECPEIFVIIKTHGIEREGVQLVSAEERSGVLLKILQCTGQFPIISMWPKMSVMLQLGNLILMRSLPLL